MIISQIVYFIKQMKKFWIFLKMNILEIQITM